MYTECCVNYCRFGRPPLVAVPCGKPALLVKFQNITQIRYFYYQFY